jgi:hypothetical protein
MIVVDFSFFLTLFCKRFNPRHQLCNMSLRTPISQFTKRASKSTISKLTSTPTSSLLQRNANDQSRSFATPAPPVTQNATSSKGPTAMVFMNMGGPQTTDDVGNFLSRLFVRDDLPLPLCLTNRSNLGRCRPYSPWTISKLPGPFNFEASNSQDPEAICSNWWRIANSKVVRISGGRNVQDIRQDIARNSSS